MGRMTKDEWATKEYLSDKLAEQGYVTYSELFELFDLRLTYNPTVIGYMEPGKGRITLNGTLDEHTLLLVIRHEIMHEYLTHEMRLLDHLAKKMGISEEAMDDVTIGDLRNIIYSSDIANIAGDYEISNRTYTDQDKKDIRKIRLNGQIVSGLVTEIDHPDWVDLPLEDMYDLLEQEREQASQEAQKDIENGDGDNQGNQSGNSEGGQEGSQGDRSGDSQGQGQQSGDQKGENSGGQSGQPGEGEGESGKGEGSDSKSQGNQKGKSQSGEGSQGEGEESDSSNDSQSGNSSDQSGNSTGGPSSGNGKVNRSSNSSPSKIIHGTFRNGKFYGLDGKEIIPGGNA